MVIAFKGLIQSYGFLRNEYSYIFIPVHWVSEAKSCDQSFRNIVNYLSHLELCKLSLRAGAKILGLLEFSIQGNEVVLYSLLVNTLILKK